jgi:hypothetical protein
MHKHILLGLVLIVILGILLWQIINKYNIVRYPKKYKKYKKYKSKKTKGKSLEKPGKSTVAKILSTMGISPQTTSIPSGRTPALHDISHKDKTKPTPISCSNNYNIDTKDDIIIKLVFYDSDINKPRYISPCYSFDVDLKGTIVTPDPNEDILNNITLGGSNIDLVYQIKDTKPINLQILRPSIKTKYKLHPKDTKLKILDSSQNTNIQTLKLKFTH